MRIDILSLFPEVFQPYLEASILQRVQAAGLLEIQVHNIRDFAAGRHRITDEAPYGGGGGMVLKPEPIFEALAELIPSLSDLNGEQDRQSGSPDHFPFPVILLTPQGRLFSQKEAQKLAAIDRFILLCGRYEGVDERVRQNLVTDELSIGDYVLTGGELAALVIVDAVARLLPGALGAEGAAMMDSHATGLLEGPHYTRPEIFRGWAVPEVLRSGHAAKIDRWRREQALRRTWERRPELLLSAELTEADKWFLASLARETDRQ